ncbi:unnamed protein product, partial [Discosporangium mesarthrocarpum]
NDPGNDPEVVLDDNHNTHWSRWGRGQWIELDLGGEVVPIMGLKIRFFNGDRRVQYFEISPDGSQLRGASSGQSNDPEFFKFPGGAVDATRVRVVGWGNMPNAGSQLGEWNSLVSIVVCGAPHGAPG